MIDEDDCIHGLMPSTCSICKQGVDTGTPKGGRSAGSPTALDTPAALEKYRKNYRGDREPTFEAYVEVFFRIDAARNFPGGWTKFSRCANAEPTLAENERALIERAEGIMKAAGYVKDDSGRPRHGRKWWNSAS